MPILGQEMEATFKGNFGYYSSLQLKWLLYVLNILGPEIWKSHLMEIHITTGYYKEEVEVTIISYRK